MTEGLSSIYPQALVVSKRVKTTTPIDKDVHDNLPLIKIIGCGGTGINSIAASYKALNVRAQNSEMKVTWDIIDTSYSNTPKLADLEITRHFISDKTDEVKGRGKLRITEEEYVDFDKKVVTIAKKLMDGDIYLIQTSTTGGSGSMITPILVRELLAHGKVVIVFAVVDTSLSASSRIEVLSTMKVLHTFNLLSDEMKDRADDGEAVTPIINLAIFDNSVSGPAKSDEAMQDYTAMLFDVLNIGNVLTMDKANLINSFNPCRIRELSDFHGVKQIVLGRAGGAAYTVTHEPEEPDTCLVKIEINGSTDVTAMVRFIGDKPDLDKGTYCLTGLTIPERLFTAIEESETKASKIKNASTQFTSARTGKVKTSGSIVL